MLLNFDSSIGKRCLKAEVRLTLVPNHCPSSDEVETDIEKAGKPQRLVRIPVGLCANQCPRRENIL